MSEIQKFTCKKTNKNVSQGKLILVREMSGKSQGNLLYPNCGHPVFMEAILHYKPTCYI